MKPTPAIVRLVPRAIGAPGVQAPIKRLLVPSRFGSVLGAVQVRTQSVVDYLAVTLFKTW
jgi:hypothetical protein